MQFVKGNNLLMKFPPVVSERIGRAIASAMPFDLQCLSVLDMIDTDCPHDATQASCMIGVVLGLGIEYGKQLAKLDE